MTSHVIRGGRRVRYDFVMTNASRFNVKGCDYWYEEAVEATGDHAFITADLSAV